MLKSKFIKVLSLTGAILFTQTAWATPPSDELLAKYNQVLKTTEHSYEKIFNRGKFSVKSNLLSMIFLEKPDLTSQQKEHIENLVDYRAGLIVELILKDGKIEQEIQHISDDIIKKLYTTEELQALIQFHSTPIRQSIIEKRRLVTEEGEKYLPRFIDTQLRTLFNQHEKEIEHSISLLYSEIESIISPSEDTPSQSKN